MVRWYDDFFNGVLAEKSKLGGWEAEFYDTSRFP
jgi:hypothetical protein